MNKNTENQMLSLWYNGSQVRTLDIDGVQWFVAKDVCDILGLQNPSDVLKNFPENERNTVGSSYGIHDGPGNPNVNVINGFGVDSSYASSNGEDFLNRNIRLRNSILVGRGLV